VTLITTNAEGIIGGKTTIKSRSVDVGVVESTTLTDDLTHVEIKARLNTGMEKLLQGDSVFWVVKPQVGREGISGLGTLLSGAYIELSRAKKGRSRRDITCWTRHHWHRRTRKVSGLFWIVTKPGNFLRAIRCCFAATG
jgi:paraquat-inducible protein B